jgi:hypothetical protein
MAAVVAPVLHTYVNGNVPVPDIAVNVVVVPAQTVAIPLMIGVKAGLTVTATAADVVEHPVLLLTVTV